MFSNADGSPFFFKWDFLFVSLITAEINHIGLVKFVETTQNEQMLDVCQRFKALKEIIPGMIEAQARITSSTHNQEYQVLLCADFEDETSLEQVRIPNTERSRLIFGKSEKWSVSSWILIDVMSDLECVHLKGLRINALLGTILSAHIVF